MSESYLTQVGEPFKGRDGKGRSVTMAIFRCVCGTEKTLSTAAVRSGNNKSCGCLKIALRSAAVRKHGMHKSKEYSTWASMISRCYNPITHGYENYGGRGITVCDRWRASVQAFVDDMGLRPDGMTLDRIDPNGNYEPANCRWATRKKQSRNRRNNHFLEAFGERLTVAEWAERLGTTSATIMQRIRKGYAVDQAVSAPVNSLRFGAKTRSKGGVK